MYLTVIIVPNLRWRTFRYRAVRASDMQGIGVRVPLGTLGNSSTDFDLITNINHAQHANQLKDLVLKINETICWEKIQLRSPS
jgi:hypothetical protein